MQRALVGIAIGLVGCAVYLTRRKIGGVVHKGLHAARVTAVSEEKITRTLGMVGIVYALIAFGLAGLMLIPTE